MMEKHGIGRALTAITGLIFAVAAGGLAFAGPPATQPTPPPNMSVPEFQSRLDRVAEIDAGAIANAHGDGTWRRKSAIQCELTVELSGQPPIEGTLICETNRGRARLNLKNGVSVIFDEEKVWSTSSGASAMDGRLRDHLLEWSYFLAAPFRLRERGIHPKAFHTAILQGQPHDTINVELDDSAKLPFTQPLIVFSDVRSHQLSGIAFTTDKNEQVAANQCITYHELQKFDGVTLATRWSFWNWKSDLEGEPIGKAQLAHFEFITPEPGTFTKPDGARELDAAAKPAAAKAAPAAPRAGASGATGSPS